jgi:hypothetical protein
MTEEFESAWHCPAEIMQRPVTGLDLEPANFVVICFASWLDMSMYSVYHPGRVYFSPVGLS